MKVCRELRVGWRLRTCAFFTVLACIVSALPCLGQGSAAGLPWSGQATCQLNLQQDGYAHQETQTWTITGNAPRADSNAPVYDATWSFSGTGSMQRVRGAQTIAAAWNRSGAPVATAIAISVRPAGQLVIRSWRSQLHSMGATTGLQKVLGAGQTEIHSDVYEWPFPAIEAAGDSADVSGTGTIAVNGGLLPMQPPSANFTAACSWHFARGAAGAVASPATDAPVTKNLAVVNSVGTGATIAMPRSMAAASGSAPAGSGGGTFTAGSTQGGTAQGNSGQGPGQAACGALAAPGAPQAVATPTVMVGPGLVRLTWTAPPGGGAVNSYDVEAQPDGSGAPTQQTVQAPATSVTIRLGVCVYPDGNCSTPGGYKFRVRAHNGAGCGPYSDSTKSVRPLVSYVGDNVAGIWTASKCLQCHTGPKVTLDLSGPAEESYSRVAIWAARNPAGRDRLLACPTGGSCSSPTNGAHPGGQGFSTTSAEYFLLLHWIQDGFRN